MPDVSDVATRSPRRRDSATCIALSDSRELSREFGRATNSAADSSVIVARIRAKSSGHRSRVSTSDYYEYILICF